LNVRLFVAVQLPDDVRAALAAWRPDDRTLRPVDVEGLHVTLCFLGWRDEARADAIGAAATACAAPVGALTVQAGLWLPPRRPGVLAVRLDDPEGRLVALQERVSDAMVRAAGYEPETRPFLPHVTVARVRRGARAPRGELAPPPALPFVPPALTLYRSHMSREGARYEPLASAPLR
jgi:RNA 2',3'-cyclic 3'-phosphodiesterase